MFSRFVIWMFHKPVAMRPIEIWLCVHYKQAAPLARSLATRSFEKI